MVTLILAVKGPFKMRTMGAGEFKAKCLAVMDEVQETGQPVLITKRGKPVARLSAAVEEAKQESPEAIFGCLRDLATVSGDVIESLHTDEEWERMFKEKWDRFDRLSSE